MKLEELDELLEALPATAQAQLAEGPAPTHSRFGQVLERVSGQKQGAEEAARILTWYRSLDAREQQLAAWAIYALCGFARVPKPMGSEEGDGEQAHG